MNGANRVSTLFSGTSIITVRGGLQQQGQEDQLEEASYNSGTNLLTMCMLEQCHTYVYTLLFTV